MREERGRACCGWPRALSLQTGLPVWPVGCRVVVEAQVHLHFHFHRPSALPCPRPLSVRVAQKSVVFCRYRCVTPLFFYPYCSCALRSSFLCHVAADPRRNLSPPAHSTIPALPAAAAIHSLPESCHSDHHLRPHRTEATSHFALREAQHGHSRPRRNPKKDFPAVDSAHQHLESVAPESTSRRGRLDARCAIRSETLEHHTRT